MSHHRTHIIPLDENQGPDGNAARRAIPDEEEVRRANIRQYCIHARAPIIWPLDLAERHHQQREFLWSQLDHCDQEQLRLNYPFPPYYYMYPPPPPPNTIRVVFPLRVINERRQQFSVIEDLPDDACATEHSMPIDGLADDTSDNFETIQIPLINSEGSVAYLIRQA